MLYLPKRVFREARLGTRDTLPALRTPLKPDAAVMWEAFVRVAFAEGAGADIVDKLALLVARGIKRATTSLERSYTEDGDPYPVTGTYMLVVDGAGNAVCIARTTSVETRPFHAVDTEFAWTEGEGDRSLAYWQAAHRAFFEREALENGFAFDDDSLVVSATLRCRLAHPRNRIAANLRGRRLAKDGDQQPVIVAHRARDRRRQLSGVCLAEQKAEVAPDAEGS